MDNLPTVRKMTGTQHENGVSHTVGSLIEFLQQFEKDTPVCFKVSGCTETYLFDASSFYEKDLISNPAGPGTYERHCKHCSGMYFGSKGANSWMVSKDHRDDNPNFRSQSQLSDMSRRSLVFVMRNPNDCEAY